MDSIKYIKKLSGDHFNGTPWLDVTILGTLKGITAEQAAEKFGGLNSIWQIVNHMRLWREALLARLMDNPVKQPDDNFISELTNTSAKAWAETIKDFERSQENIISFLESSKDNMLEKVSPASGYSYFELAMSIMLHDTYHLGQIVLLTKLIK